MFIGGAELWSGDVKCRSSGGDKSMSGGKQNYYTERGKNKVIETVTKTSAYGLSYVAG